MHVRYANGVLKMTVNQKPYAAVMWLKQKTTGTFLSINKNIDRVEFLGRNKKLLVTVAVLWCLLVIGGVFLLNRMAQHKLDDYTQAIAAAVDQLAERSSSILLEGKIGICFFCKQVCKRHDCVPATLSLQYTVGTSKWDVVYKLYKLYPYGYSSIFILMGKACKKISALVFIASTIALLRR